MLNRDLDEKSRLVALARKKAEARGTTLEQEVQSWLARYVKEPEKKTAPPTDGASAARWPASKTKISRAVGSINKTKLPPPSSRDTRSEAYRRLLGVISDTTKRTS